jgi:hypothetical protein
MRLKPGECQCIEAKPLNPVLFGQEFHFIVVSKQVSSQTHINQFPRMFLAQHGHKLCEGNNLASPDGIPGTFRVTIAPPTMVVSATAAIIVVTAVTVIVITTIVVVIAAAARAAVAA